MEHFIVPMIATLTTCITQTIKHLIPNETKRYLPIVAGIIGIAANMFTHWSNITIKNFVETATVGLSSGLAGCGLFELGKGIMKRDA